MNPLPPNNKASLSDEVDHVQVKGRTLAVNEYALDSLRGFIRNYLAELIYEADRRARIRGGNDIQSGDIESAKEYLEGRARGRYWAVFLGSGFFGAGLQGFVEAVAGSKGSAFVALYLSFIILGLLLVYYGAPRR